MEQLREQQAQLQKQIQNQKTQLHEQQNQLHEQQNQLEQSLQALVTTLRDYCSSPEEIYEKIRKNKPFESVTLEDIKQML